MRWLPVPYTASGTIPACPSAPIARTLGFIGCSPVHHIITIGGFLTHDGHRPLNAEAESAEARFADASQ